jgi:flavodoxin I
MKILIVYASYTGSTELIAQDVADVLQTKGHSVTLQKAAQTNVDDLDQYDVVLMGSTSWDLQGNAGFPHNAMFSLIDETLKEKVYADKAFACFGCGDTDFANFTGAVTHLEEFVKAKQGKLITESLRLNKFWVDMEKGHEQGKQWADQVAEAIN